MNKLNAFQTISIVGLIFSAIVQITLIVIDKHVDTIWALYPTWAFVFLFGYLLKKFTKEEDHSH